jgi:hypothetical protein
MARLRVADDVALKEEGGEAFLLHLPSGRYFGLNRTGLVIWEAIRTGADPVAALGERWPDVPEADREADAARLIDSLRKAELVVESAG